MPSRRKSEKAFDFRGKEGSQRKLKEGPSCLFRARMLTNRAVHKNRSGAVYALTFPLPRNRCEHGTRVQASRLSGLVERRSGSPEGGNGPHDQQPEWDHSQARNRFQRQTRQQQPLPAQHEKE
jgi:hypothetical protein